MAFSISSRLVRFVLIGGIVGLIGGAVVGSLFHSPPAERPGATDEQDGAFVPQLDAPTAALVARRIETDGAPQRVLSTCPAEQWRRRVDLSHQGTVKPVACAKTAADCLADCLDFSSGTACVSLARILEKTPDVDPLMAQTLYALACAAGRAGGCVNRAAGLRNGAYAKDPFAHDAPVRQACEARSFTIGCDERQSWGCAMRGQARERGEGFPADAAAAKQDYARACAIAPAFAACGFAKARQAAMEKPEAKDD